VGTRGKVQELYVLANRKSNSISQKKKKESVITFFFFLRNLGDRAGALADGEKSSLGLVWTTSDVSQSGQ
jgi:hypothetical protein